MSSTWSNLNSCRINFLNLGNNSVAFNQVNTVIIFAMENSRLAKCNQKYVGSATLLQERYSRFYKNKIAKIVYHIRTFTNN